jgi:signal transduction histidine kinase
LEKEKADWNEKLRQMQSDAQDIERRQTQIRSREAEIDGLRQQLTASLDAPGKVSPQAVQSLVEDWVFGFAHQVRNPLGIIRSMSESMMNAKMSPKTQKESFTAILQAVDGLARRLGEFIDFSKPVKGSPRESSLSVVAENAVAALRERATQQNTQIQLQLSDGIPALMIDPDQVQTAVMHILANALEAMPQGGTLTVETREESGKVVLRVQDSGCGISAIHLKEIGRPFFSTKPGRIGLGVAAAKRILHAFGGEISFESQLGQGTTVICRFTPRVRGK